MPGYNAGSYLFVLVYYRRKARGQQRKTTVVESASRGVSAIRTVERGATCAAEETASPEGMHEMQTVA